MNTPGRELLLPRLEIRNFRLFQSLTMERLGRVNLLVGRNGAGKTSFLDAIATTGLPHRFVSIQEGAARAAALPGEVVRSANGLLLIDEIENGIHYSLFPDIWRAVFRDARLENVQVFAATHSWDCLRAFTIAMNEDPAADGYVIRLEPFRGAIRAAGFGKAEMMAAIRERIEVR